MWILDTIKEWGYLKYTERQSKFIELNNNQVLVISHRMDSADVEVSYWIRTDEDAQTAYQSVVFTHKGVTEIKKHEMK